MGSENQEEDFFYQYIKDGLASLLNAKLIHNYLKNLKEPKSFLRNMENQKMFCLGRTAEVFLKATLFVYTGILVTPILDALLKGVKIDPNDLDDVKKSLEILITQATNLERIEELGHYPAQKSHIRHLMNSTINLLYKIKEKELAKIFETLSNYLGKDPINIGYNDYVDARQKVLDMAKKLVNGLSFISIIKALVKLFPQSIQKNKVTEEDVNQLLFFSEYTLSTFLNLLITAHYLSVASVRAFYSAGWDQPIKDYMEDIKAHQEEIMNILTNIGDDLNNLIESREFLDLYEVIRIIANTLLTQH